MPKSFSEYEKKQIKLGMYKAGIQLIKEKGIRKTTVEDITKRTKIAKGSFYAFYQSKEDFFYKLLDKYEEKFVEEMKQTLSVKGNKKEKIMKVLRQCYLSEDSIGFYMSSEDTEFIARKLQLGDWVDAVERSKRLYEPIYKLCDKEMSLINLEIASQLIRAIKFTALSEEPFSIESRDRTIDIFVNNFADFLIGNSERE